MIFSEMALGFLEYLMGMEVQRFLNIVQMLYQMFIFSYPSCLSKNMQNLKQTSKELLKGP